MEQESNLPSDRVEKGLNHTETSTVLATNPAEIRSGENQPLVSRVRYEPICFSDDDGDDETAGPASPDCIVVDEPGVHARQGSAPTHPPDDMRPDVPREDSGDRQGTPRVLGTISLTPSGRNSFISDYRVEPESPEPQKGVTGGQLRLCSSHQASPGLCPEDPLLMHSPGDQSRNGSSGESQPTEFSGCQIDIDNALADGNVGEKLLPWQRNGNDLTCSLCNFKTRWPVSLSYHMRQHSQLVPFKCTRCGEGFMYKHQVEKHYCTGNEEENTREQVRDCDEQTPRPSEAEKQDEEDIPQDSALEESEITNENSSCSTIEETDPDIQDPSHKCSTCEKSFPDSEALTEHHCDAQACPANSAVYRCQFCSDTFQDISDVEAHLVAHHNVPGKDALLTVNISRRRRKPMRRRLKDGYVHCKYCSYRSVKSMNVHTHETKKHGIDHRPRTFLCKLCENVFESADLILDHIMQEHDQAGLATKLSEHYILDSTVLDGAGKEMKGISLKGNYHCSECNFISNVLHEVFNHRTTHSDTMTTKNRTSKFPYQCKLCSYKSRLKASLTGHTRLKHSQDKRVQSRNTNEASQTLINYRSAQSRPRRQNAQGQNTNKVKGTMTLQDCPMCDFSTKYLRSLYNHLRVHHPEQTSKHESSLQSKRIKFSEDLTDCNQLEGNSEKEDSNAEEMERTDEKENPNAKAKSQPEDADMEIEDPDAKSKVDEEEVKEKDGGEKENEEVDESEDDALDSNLTDESDLDDSDRDPAWEPPGTVKRKRKQDTFSDDSDVSGDPLLQKLKKKSRRKTCDSVSGEDTSEVKRTRGKFKRDPKALPPVRGEDDLFHCRFCQFQSKYSKNLECHEWRHTGFMPYQCDVCKKKFRQRAQLMKHRCNSLSENSASAPSVCTEDVGERRLSLGDSSIIPDQESVPVQSETSQSSETLQVSMLPAAEPEGNPGSEHNEEKEEQDKGWPVEVDDASPATASLAHQNDEGSASPSLTEDLSEQAEVQEDTELASIDKESVTPFINLGASSVEKSDIVARFAESEPPDSVPEPSRQCMDQISSSLDNAQHPNNIPEGAETSDPIQSPPDPIQSPPDPIQSPPDPIQSPPDPIQSPPDQIEPLVDPSGKDPEADSNPLRAGTPEEERSPEHSQPSDTNSENVVSDMSSNVQPEAVPPEGENVISGSPPIVARRASEDAGDVTTSHGSEVIPEDQETNGMEDQQVSQADQNGTPQTTMSPTPIIIEPPRSVEGPEELQDNIADQSRNSPPFCRYLNVTMHTQEGSAVTISDLYLCSQCRIYFEDEVLYRQHLSLHGLHQGSCNRCSQVFPMATQFAAHLHCPHPCSTLSQSMPAMGHQQHSMNMQFVDGRMAQQHSNSRGMHHLPLNVGQGMDRRGMQEGPSGGPWNENGHPLYPGTYTVTPRFQQQRQQASSSPQFVNTTLSRRGRPPIIRPVRMMQSNHTQGNFQQQQLATNLQQMSTQQQQQFQLRSRQLAARGPTQVGNRQLWSDFQQQNMGRPRPPVHSQPMYRVPDQQHPLVGSPSTTHGPPSEDVIVID